MIGKRDKNTTKPTKTKGLNKKKEGEGREARSDVFLRTREREMGLGRFLLPDEGVGTMEKAVDLCFIGGGNDADVAQVSEVGA